MVIERGAYAEEEFGIKQRKITRHEIFLLRAADTDPDNVRF